jgi:hypothetical protein
VLHAKNAPVAADDGYTTLEDTPLVVAAAGILANDTDPDLDPLQALLITDVTNGTLVLNADGSFTYTPHPNFAGADSFTYQASDGSVDSNLTTVMLTVIPVNDVTVAADDGYTTLEDTPLVVAAAGILIELRRISANWSPNPESIRIFQFISSNHGFIRLWHKKKWSRMVINIPQLL